MAQALLHSFAPTSVPMAHVAFHADGAWTVQCGASEGGDDEGSFLGWIEA